MLFLRSLTLFLGAQDVVVSASAYSKSPYSSVTLPRPKGRSDWHHEQFQKLYLASLDPQAQTNFGYWCGPTLGGYCGSTSFDDINTNAVTHALFAFASITPDGTVSYEYDQGSVQQYNSSILIAKGTMAGLSLGGSGTDADNCLENIDNCVTTLGKTLGYYESVGSPFYFVDSDFEKPKDVQQMQNLITFWTMFNEQFPGYLITMAPECAYLWCGAASWPYNSYVPVINALGPYGANIIYKINAQSYNNWCSYSPAGTAQFFEDVATTWITACPSTGYQGLESNPEIFGLGVLAADKDGDGFASPSIVAEALQWIGGTYGSYNGMFWDTLTDLENNWIISNGIASAAPKGSVTPTNFPTSHAPTRYPTNAPSSPTGQPTGNPTSPTGQPSGAPSASPTVMSAPKSDSNTIALLIYCSAGLAGFLAMCSIATYVVREITGSVFGFFPKGPYRPVSADDLSADDSRLSMSEVSTN